MRRPSKRFTRLSDEDILDILRQNRDTLEEVSLALQEIQAELLKRGDGGEP